MRDHDTPGENQKETHSPYLGIRKPVPSHLGCVTGSGSLNFSGLLYYKRKGCHVLHPVWYQLKLSVTN